MLGWMLDGAAQQKPPPGVGVSFTRHHLGFPGFAPLRADQTEQFVNASAKLTPDPGRQIGWSEWMRSVAWRRTSIENVVAEIGSDMSQFRDEHHLMVWAGVSPGNEESAGKRLRNRTGRKNRGLRRRSPKRPGSAGRTKKQPLGPSTAVWRHAGACTAFFCGRRSQAQSLLVIFYHILKYDVEYQRPESGLL